MAGFGRRPTITNASAAAATGMDREPTGAAVFEPAPSIRGLIAAPEPERKIPFIAIVAIAMLACGGIAYWLSAPPKPAVIAAPKPPGAPLLAENPGLQALFEVVLRDYPDAYPDLLSRTSAPMKQGDVAATVRAAWQAAAPVFERDKAFFSKADADALASWVQAALAMMSRVQEKTPEACAQLTIGAMSPQDQAADPAALDAASGMLAAMLAAAHSGKTNPQTYTPLTRTDEWTLRNMLVNANITAEETRTVMANTRSPGIPEARRCAVIIKVMQTMLASPEPTRAHLLGALAKGADRTL